VRFHLIRHAVAFGGLAFAFAACGGSADGTTEPSSDQLIADICAKKAAMPCASSSEQQDCLGDLQVDQADAQQEGCQAELSLYLKCASSHPLYCGGVPEQPPSPHAADECGALHVAFGECYSRIPADCGVGVGAGTCSILCPDFSSICHGPDPNGPVDCSCDKGPHQGTTFHANDCAKSLVYATGHTCR
jgi:hypothetical protein